MTKPKVFIYPGDSYHAAIEMFEKRGFDVVKDFEGIDLVCFLGGTDVDPAIYNEERHPKTQHPDRKRDDIEVAGYNRFIGIPKVGICRGGQLLNVLNGGRMIQDLGEYISGDVPLYGYVEPSSWKATFKGLVRVDHHQGIVAVNGTELSWPEDWNHGDDLMVSYACYYEDTKSLCFQAHPEWGHAGTEDYFFELLETKLNLKGLA